VARIISTDAAPTGSAAGPFPYSQAVTAAGLIFVSGQPPLDPVTGQIVGDTIQEQTRQSLKNVQAILEAAGSSMDRIVNVTFVLSEASDVAGLNEEFARWFPTDPPARSGAKHPAPPPGVRISMAVIAEA
jgi:2-iminobutanoate/2-iminopropanoate deaminase